VEASLSDSFRIGSSGVTFPFNPALHLTEHRFLKRTAKLGERFYNCKLIVKIMVYIFFITHNS